MWWFKPWQHGFKWFSSVLATVTTLQTKPVHRYVHWAMSLHRLSILYTIVHPTAICRQYVIRNSALNILEYFKGLYIDKKGRHPITSPQICVIFIMQSRVPVVSDYFSKRSVKLTHCGRDKIDAISQTTFSIPFSWMIMHEFCLRVHCSLFLRFEFTIFQHWFR